MTNQDQLHELVGSSRRRVTNSVQLFLIAWFELTTLADAFDEKSTTLALKYLRLETNLTMTELKLTV